VTSLICAPEGYDAVRTQSRSSRVLRYLLVTYPNQVISHRQVCEVLGYEVGSTAVSNAASRLRSGPFGLPIRSLRGNGGGYILLVPVPAGGDQSCGCCKNRSLISTCSVLKGRPVGPREWCRAWQ
jgi:hypothetical protein